jgi:Asp-tRNA(Asn)/Glu-tRNA(Gln) amidotransferase A subunit family amidase
MTDRESGDDLPDVSGAVESLAERAQNLTDSPDSEPDGRSDSDRFPAVTPVERADPHGAFATAFEAKSAAEGTLDDLRLVVKDNVAVRGVTHRLGTGELAWSPERDATVVTRLRQAGAELHGTTQMDAFAMGATGESCAQGRTENPVCDGHVPGGSSSGSATAVAGGVADAALGTDTGGSVRVPAAFCGLVGVKPTFDRVPRTGVADLAPTLDHVGVLAEGVDTAARVLETVSGSDPSRPETATATAVTSVADVDSTSLRLAVPEEFLAAAEPGVRTAVTDALGDAAAAGATTERVAFPEFDRAEFTNQLHTIPEFAGVFDGSLPPGFGCRFPSLRAALAEFPATALPERVQGLLAIGRGLRDHAPDSYAAAWQFRRRVIDRTQSIFRSFDALVTPTTGMPAPPFGAVGDGSDDRYEVSDLLAGTAPFDLTGQPAVSVPVGAADGRPVGLQVVTPAGTDERALGIARLLASRQE